MGRNFYSVCHECQVQLMHLRGKEGKWMQQFANKHAEHESQTQIYSDYIEEAPASYTDVFDDYYKENKQDD